MELWGRKPQRAVPGVPAGVRACSSSSSHSPGTEGRGSRGALSAAAAHPRSLLSARLVSPLGRRRGGDQRGPRARGRGGGASKPEKHEFKSSLTRLTRRVSRVTTLSAPHLRSRNRAWHGGPTLQSERTRLVCVTSLRPEDTSRGPGRAGAAPHGERPRPRGGPGRCGAVCGAAPRTPSRCRASGPQQRAQAAFSEDRGARAGAVAPSEEAALGRLLRAEAASGWPGRPCALRTRRCG